MRETLRARQGWADYVAMGPGRSLAKLAGLYAGRRQNDGRAMVPTVRLCQLEIWSRVFGWQARLQVIAEREARAAEEREAAYRREILEAGYGLAHERVKVLKDLARRLQGELTAEGADSRLWVRDVKQIGKGKEAERVDVERFNAAEVEQFRGLLADIAKEKGERQEVRVLAGDAERPVVVHTIMAEIPPEVAAAMAAGEGEQAGKRGDG